ncbi:SRPBCC domain-containing protein [Poseidonocella sp. HB161398]|uniref:SRPBCC domain-containing protein n=1 Tax=Poseidonocella sp. HB161398 TaxID=2320855 RepID=UPI0011097322|nr:SRPBCC domain-containing protein [Poseidonocella sp. HB161398]
MQIAVETLVHAPVETVWACWTTPGDILEWNAASPDWHTTHAELDLVPGGRFRSRMEARDGSTGFDFEGTFVRIEEMSLIESTFGGRRLKVWFQPAPGGTLVREVFDPEDEHPAEMQRQGWQAILDNFARHVEAKMAAEAG